MNDLPASDRGAAADRLAIIDLIYRYCRSMDRLDREEGYAIWHEGATADYGPTIYRGSGRGFIDFVTDTHMTMEGQSHQISNIIIELDGDTATSESYVTAVLRRRRDAGLFEVTTRGRYLDEWAFREGRWGIVRRVYVHDFDRTAPAGEPLQPSTMRRDRSDLSYAFIKRIGNRLETPG
jgi:hypothetical protein